VSIDWTFALDPQGEWQGINNSGIETFAARPIVSLAREIIQNSLDVVEDETKPIQIDFNLKAVSPNDLPGLDNLSKKIDSCIKDKNNSRDLRTKTKLEDAKVAINKHKIDVLCVSEENTLGMRGPESDIGSPFFTYIKATGSSADKAEGLGSFGIGKMAPVACSRARSVQIVTRYTEKSKSFDLCGGVSFLVSHRDDTNAIIQAKGYWGNKGKAVTDQNLIPEWMRRKTNGTNFFILGFLIGLPWKEILCASVLISFFDAIKNHRLEVVIGDDYRLTAASLEDLFQSGTHGELMRTLDAAGREDLIEELALARDYYRCLHEAEVIVENFQVSANSAGNFEVRLLKEEGLPKKVGFIRGGMFITNSSDTNFPNLKRFPDFADFIAVVQSLTKEGNALLREMEPPEHNAFHESRLKNGKGLLNAIGKQTRNQLAQHLKIESSSLSALEFTADLFGDQADEATENDTSSLEMNPDGAPLMTVKPIKQRVPRQSSPIIVDVGDEGGEGSAGSGKTDGSGGDAGTADGGDGDKPGASGGKGSDPDGAPVSVSNFRVAKSVAGGINVFMSFPNIAGEVVCKFYVAGSYSDELMPVKKTSYGEIHNNGIKFRISMGQRIQANIDIGTTEDIAVKVAAYAL